MRDEPRSPSRHQLDHVVPTVIHDPEEKMPALARWLRHAMANPTRFWGLVAALVVGVIALGILSNGLTLGRSKSDAAWLKIESAKSASERVEFAHEYPKSQAEQWALLQSATEFYNQGFVDLPANRDAALPALKKALDLFDEVAGLAPQDSPQARAAALGAARTLEARKDLERAIKQYEKVASTWKGTPEAAEAQRLAAALRRPENVAFYNDLYNFKPIEATLAPMGQGGMLVPPNHPPIDGPVLSPSMIPPMAPPSGPAKAETPPTRIEIDPSLLPPPPPASKSEVKEKTALPPDVFAPAAEPPAPKPETPKSDPPGDPSAPKD